MVILHKLHKSDLANDSELEAVFAFLKEGMSIFSS